jgi:hypothetical protein
MGRLQGEWGCRRVSARPAKGPKPKEYWSPMVGWRTTAAPSDICLCERLDFAKTVATRRERSGTQRAHDRTSSLLLSADLLAGGTSPMSRRASRQCQAGSRHLAPMAGATRRSGTPEAARPSVHLVLALPGNLIAARRSICGRASVTPRTGNVDNPHMAGGAGQPVTRGMTRVRSVRFYRLIN